jgi:antigen KI-67
MQAFAVVIRRDGSEGSRVALASGETLFGRSMECDVRIQLAEVSKRHAGLVVGGKGTVSVSV